MYGRTDIHWTDRRDGKNSDLDWVSDAYFILDLVTLRYLINVQQTLFFFGKSPTCTPLSGASLAWVHGNPWIFEKVPKEPTKKPSNQMILVMGILGTHGLEFLTRPLIDS